VWELWELCVGAGLWKKEGGVVRRGEACGRWGCGADEGARGLGEERNYMVTGDSA
jgi:hypothetical protein